VRGKGRRDFRVKICLTMQYFNDTKKYELLGWNEHTNSIERIAERGYARIG